MRNYSLVLILVLFFTEISVSAQQSTDADSIVYEYDTIHTVNTVKVYDSPIPSRMLYGNVGFAWQVQNIQKTDFSAYSNAIGSAVHVAFAYDSHVFETGLSILNNNQIFTKEINSIRTSVTSNMVTDSSVRFISEIKIDTIARYREKLPDTTVYRYVTTQREIVTKRIEYRTSEQTKVDSVVTKKKLALCNQYRIIEIPLRYGFRWRHKYFEANLKLGSLFRWIVYSSSTNINPLQNYALESSDSFTHFYLGACADISMQYLLSDKVLAHCSIKYTIFPSVKVFDQVMNIQTIGTYFGISYILK